jgi:hypothetical protein
MEGDCPNAPLPQTSPTDRLDRRAGLGLANGAAGNKSWAGATKEHDHAELSTSVPARSDPAGASDPGSGARAWPDAGTRPRSPAAWSGTRLTQGHPRSKEHRWQPDLG